MAVSEDTNGRKVFIECDKKTTLDIQLNVRHASSLTIRNVTWFVATRPANDPLLCRDLLKALGLDAKAALAAACETFNGQVDAEQLLSDQDYPDGSIARLLSENGVYHNGHYPDETDDCESVYLEIGIDKDNDIQTAFDKMLHDAKSNGMSTGGAETLEKILHEYRDVFRIRLGNDPPAKVEPMKVVLRPQAQGIITKSRRYSPEQRDYLTRFLKRAKHYGFITENKNATWAAAPLLVLKPKSKKYRLTFDYRPVNAATNSIGWPMPHLESECVDFAGSTCFASIDFCSGYWQLPLHKDSQSALSFITHEGVWQPTRTPQGAKNSACNFQSRVEPCFIAIRKHVKAWQDDFILHHKDENGLMDTLRCFLQICRDRNLKISATKSTLFTSSVKWCGRIIDKDGVQFDPSNLSGLMNITSPQTAGELSQYIYCLQWMSQSIPDFANRISCLRNVLEEAYTKSGKRTKKSIASIPLSSLSWGRQHDKSFLELQDSLRQSVKLAHPDAKMHKCIYTDASDNYWAAVVTQCLAAELNKPLEDQRHQPLAFISSSFKDSELHWSTYEKEGFSIYQVFKRLDYLLLGSIPSHVYTDHRNLLFVYNPMSIEPAMGRHIVNKVQRWALFLSRFHYTIEHIAGDSNVMADVMTRWFVGYRQKKLTSKITAIRKTHSHTEDIVSSPLSSSFIWPTPDTIRKSQQQHIQDKPNGCELHDQGLVITKKKIWIPQQDVQLQMKLLVISHCGQNGHRGSTATINILSENYWWNTMTNDCKVFVQNCIHCIMSYTGQRIPRPLGSTEIATRPNQILHFDYLYMGRGNTRDRYVLILRDGFSCYTWLCIAKAADAETVVESIAKWIEIFSAMDVWISDQGSHFKNQVMTQLAKRHYIRHHFTVAYSPWSNGAVERCCREVLRATTALMSELRLAPQDWPDVISLIQKIINESPVERLGKREDGIFRSPLEVMTGIKPARTNPTSSMKCGDNSLSLSECQRIANIDRLQFALANMHKNVSEKIRANRARQIKIHNERTNIIHPSFSIGDFVLVRKAHNKGHKLAFKWQGPKRITKVINSLVYEVTSLTNGQTEIVHATRIFIYRCDMDGIEPSKGILNHAAHTEAEYEDIKCLRQIKKHGDTIKILVEWEGLPDTCDYTWEPVENLFEDIPEMLMEYLRHENNSIARRAIASLSKSK